MNLQIELAGYTLERPSNYTIAGIGFILALIGIGILLYRAGFFGFLKKVHNDCLLDHASGKYTINNLARVTVLYTFLFSWVAVHFKLELTPFHISPIPFTEVELGLILGFIIGAEWIRRKREPDTTIQVKSETTNIETPAAIAGTTPNIPVIEPEINIDEVTPVRAPNGRFKAKHVKA